MNEIAPGILHWKATHPKIKIEVSSYYLVDERTLIDPMVPAGGLERFGDLGEPRHAVLTNRHHWRDCGRFVEAFGITVHASRPGLHEFGESQPVEPFDYGEEPVPGLRGLEIGVICPDETAVHVRAHRALALADGLINYAGLGFFPDEYIGDDPEAVKRGLREAYAGLLELDVDHLLFAHGEPVVGGGGQALRKFTGAG